MTTATRPLSSRSMPSQRLRVALCEGDLAGGERRRAAVVERDAQCAVVVDAGAGALAVLPACTGWPSSASRSRSAASVTGDSSARRCSSASSSSVSVGSTSSGLSPSVPATAAASGGSVVGSTATLTPIPSTAQPGSWRASTRMPATFRPSSQTSLGHLTSALGPATSATASPARSGSRSSKSRSTSEAAIASPRRRRPAPALPAAAGGLLVGGDERAVRRAGLGQLRARARWSTPIGLVVLAGLAEAHAQPQLVAVRDAQQLRGAAAVDGDRDLARRVLVDHEPARRRVAERAADDDVVAVDPDRRRPAARRR